MQNPEFEQTVCKRYNFADRPSGVPHLSGVSPTSPTSMQIDPKTEKKIVIKSGKTPFITNYRENSQVLFLLTADPVLLAHQKHSYVKDPKSFFKIKVLKISILNSFLPKYNFVVVQYKEFPHKY